MSEEQDLREFATFFSAIAMFFAANAHGDENHIGDGVQNLPLFDAHIHYKEPAWGPYPPETVLKLMDESGVAMGLVSSTPDEGTITLWHYAPNRIVPELRPYHGNAGSSNWTTAPGMYDYIKRRLDTYPHEGIGEFHLHDGLENKTLLRKVARLAIERDLYIHVHSGKAPVDFLFSLEPRLKIIWAHAGMTESAATVEAMMARYTTLYADTSYRESDILTSGGTIDGDWRRVLERFSERFMVGSDTWVNGQWDDYRELIALNRKWLSQFSRPIAERIAYKNAETLFKRKVDKRLLGTR